MNQIHKVPVERLTYRMSELASAFGVSRRTIERERSAGRFPKPNFYIGRAPLWTKEVISNWIEHGGTSKKYAHKY
jgi:predicted DNA-binding transcriptional regulator AlpA